MLPRKSAGRLPPVSSKFWSFLLFFVLQLHHSSLCFCYHVTLFPVYLSSHHLSYFQRTTIILDQKPTSLITSHILLMIRHCTSITQFVQTAKHVVVLSPCHPCDLLYWEPREALLTKWRHSPNPLSLSRRHGPRMKELGLVILTCFFLSSVELAGKLLRSLLFLREAWESTKPSAVVPRK